MARDFYIAGECMVRVRFGKHVVIYGGVGSNPISGSQTIFDLGLTESQVRFNLRYNHEDVHVNDYDKIPADVMWMMGEGTVSMNLIHFDRKVLDAVMQESMGGFVGQLAAGGACWPAGVPLGNGLATQTSGNHFMELQLITQQNPTDPWIFPTAYLAGTPVEWPLGTEKSVVQCSWRTIPFNDPSTSMNIAGFSGDISVATTSEVQASGAAWFRH